MTDALSPSAESAAVTAIRALLLTDVVESTQLSERLGDRAMAEVWAAHDRAARDLLPHWRGREIDKTDGMLLLFDLAGDAVQYALAYHRALAALPVPLKARAGLHVGPVVLRENPPEDVARGAKPLEVDGLAKPTTARVMSLARGAQTLLTPEAHRALRDGSDGGGLQTPLHTRSHGHWVLKGVSLPIELFEVGDDSSTFAAPSDSEKIYRVVKVNERWLPARRIANNLPEQPNAFIGRERELSDIKSLLGACRLLTLLGMGGLGKTRLSLQVAAELMAEYPDGVWFLDLAPLRDGALVVAEAARAMGVREEPGRPLLQTLCAHLKGQRALIILDNCEHLLKPSAALAHAILKAAPRVALLASSGVPLRVPGERSYPILPLAVPSRNDSLDELSRSTAVRLFVERAQDNGMDFELTEAIAPDVAELVSRLEGIPLALELAAARARSMTVADINRRLKNRYKVLTGGSIVRDERQQTLRALVDWSYDLLDAPEKGVLQRLAAFSGGFDLEAAESVCAAGEVDADDVLDLLSSLVEKSLVALEQREGRGRFRMLETIRDYAVEKLADSGDEPATVARHCSYFFDLSKQANKGTQGPQQGDWLDRLEREQDNLRAAMLHAQAGHGGIDPFIAVKMAVALQNFWIMRGSASEGRAAVAAMLALPVVQGSDVAQAHALYVGGTLASVQGDLAEALRMLQSCLRLRRGLDNPANLAETLSTLAVTRLSNGDAAHAREAGVEALQLFRRCGHRVGEAISLVQLGQIDAWLGDDAAATQHLHEALAIARQIKHPETEAEAELVLGQLALASGDIAAAEQGFERSLAVCSAAGDRPGTASANWALGRVDLAAGRMDAARQRLREALVDFERYEMRELWLGCLEDHAALALETGALPAAVALAAAAERLRDGARLVRSPHAQLRWTAVLLRLRDEAGEALFDAAWRQGQSWDTAHSHRQALALAALEAA